MSLNIFHKSWFFLGGGDPNCSNPMFPFNYLFFFPFDVSVLEENEIQVLVPPYNF